MSYLKRLENIQKLLKECSCDALLVDDAINLFYMTGLDLSAGKLLIDTRTAHLFVDGRYFELCSKKSPFPVLLAETHPLHEQLILPDFSFIKAIAFDSENTSHKKFIELSAVIEKTQKHAHNKRKFTLVPLDNPIQHLRMIKDVQEIDDLRQAGKLGSEGFDYACSILKEGITEKEVACELDIFWKKSGGRKVAFESIIAFGVNGSMPHYRGGDVKLQKNQAVLIDIGVDYKYYNSDMTRMAFFGKAPEQISIIHTIVQHAQRHAMDLCKPGSLIGDIDAAARSFIESQGYGENFTHGLGHGVGLEVHELPVVKNKPPFASVVLQEGMVLTIEPGIYLPGVGGVRIEDTVVITESGYESLTNRSTDPFCIA